MKRYLAGANAIPAVIDPALLDASVAAFRTAVGKLINAKKAPDSQSPLTVEATYPAACSEFVKAVSK